MSPAETSDLNSIGVVLASNGEVFLQSDSGMRQVEAGSPVYRGEELITGAGGSAEIRFVDDTLLSQGSDSSINLDNYVFDDAADSTSELLFNMTQGTFRMVTGKIAEQNPERFKVGSPLATIGIRGTITVHEIGANGEKHGVEEIHSGKALLVQSIDGELRQISSPRALVDIASSGLMSTVRPMTVQEFEQFQSVAPAAIQAEKEIIEQRQQEQQEQQEQDQEELQGEDGPAEEQGEGDAEQGAAEPQPVAVEGVFGGEMGANIVGGSNALSPVVDGALAGAFGFDAVNPVGADAEALGIAQEALDALAEGYFEAAAEFLEQLEDVVAEITVPEEDLDDPDIIALIENVTEGIPDIPNDSEIPEDRGGDESSGDSITFALGSEQGQYWEGTTHTDYYDGRGGNDEIDGIGGDDTLMGGDGDDTIWGGNGNDVIYGGEDNDVIDGEEGNDALYGGLGDDTLTGGQGDDVINGGDGVDTVSYEGVSAVNASLYDEVADGSMGNDTLINIENIIGSDQGDTLMGSDDANYLMGGDGNDTLTGRIGIDTLEGGIGTDTLTGGADADFFYYKTLCGCGDKITDFVSGEDKFKFLNEANGGDFADVPTFDTISNAYDGSNASLGGSGSAYAGIVYDNELNQLWYDSNGDDVGGNTLVATLINGASVLESDIDTEAIA
ncbi:FecR domain-containing protein [Maridesulfovibrio frigidus]|uniref:FecR domain-containing protein n=1 Tax=Maridesulfovibrio frigidus TaxID=340956 RepID=UPI00068DCC52|nr:FecR domain-containing protein [Maridesulfovibrio frigidus]